MWIAHVMFVWQVNSCDGSVRFMHAHPQFGNILCGIAPLSDDRES